MTQEAAFLNASTPRRPRASRSRRCACSTGPGKELARASNPQPSAPLIGAGRRLAREKKTHRGGPRLQLGNPFEQPVDLELVNNEIGLQGFGLGECRRILRIPEKGDPDRPVLAADSSNTTVPCASGSFKSTTTTSWPSSIHSPSRPTTPSTRQSHGPASYGDARNNPSSLSMTRIRRKFTVLFLCTQGGSAGAQPGTPRDTARHVTTAARAAPAVPLTQHEHEPHRRELPSTESDTRGDANGGQAREKARAGLLQPPGFGFSRFKDGGPNWKRPDASLTRLRQWLKRGTCQRGGGVKRDSLRPAEG
jgi:hypothetical protein